MDNKTRLIGHIGAYKIPIVPEVKIPLIIHNMDYIEINGKTYTERPQPPKKQMSRVELMAMAMANMERYTYGGSNYTRPFPELKNSLVDEFRLIQEKKSRLTSAERKMVENQFHRVYKEVQNGNAQ